jgi:hypothetical protein
MNVPDLDNPPPSEVQQPSPAAILNSTVETVLAPAESNGASRSGRAHGKVARLPKATRDQINFWMRDGLSYPDIIQRLGPQGEGLTPNNLSEWKRRAHQDWLVEQAFIERTRARQETPGDLVRDFDATAVSHAALQLGTLHIFEALRDLSHSSSDSESSSSSFSSSSSPSPSDAPSSAIDDQRLPIPPADSPRSSASRRSALDLRLGGDSAAFVRLMNALARSSRETMLLQKYREACAKAREAVLPLRDPKRKLTDSERRAIVRNVDEMFGIAPDDDEPNPVSEDERVRRIMLSDDPRIWQPLRY